MNTVDKSIRQFLVLLLIPAVGIQTDLAKVNINSMRVLKNLSMFANTVDRNILRFLVLLPVHAVDIRTALVKENMHLHCK